MGKAQLAKYIISETDYDITPEVKNELTTPIDKSTIEVIIRILKEMPTESTEEEIRDEIDDIIRKSNASGSVHFKNPKKGTPKQTPQTPKKVSRKTREEYIALICEKESQATMAKGYDLGIFDRDEFEGEFLDDMTTKESTKFQNTGIIPKEQLKTAMTEINNAVKNQKFSLTYQY
eukprot:g10766.t1